MLEFADHDKTGTLDAEGNGYYQCYCNGYSTSTDALDDSKFCYQYQFDKNLLLVKSNLITVIIVVLNYVFKSLVIYMMNRIGFTMQSRIILNIATFVFLSQYANTGLILLLANANFENTPLDFINIRNQFSDFTNDWYRQVGSTIVQTMIIQIFIPIGTLLLNMFLIWLRKFRDSGCSKDSARPNTKSTTVQKFIKVFAGPEVTLDFRYSNIIYQVYIAFTYGLALPVLFPIVMLSMTSLMICEKLQFAYFYRKPPIFGNNLNQRGLNLIIYAPVAMMLMGYWMLGNR